MHGTERPYVSAAGKDWLLPFFDPFTRLLGVRAHHRALISQAAIAPGQRVLEIGCGTGNMAILARELNPAAEVFAIDPDPKALARARRKAQRRHAAVTFEQSFSENLPYNDASFDRVLSAFMLHHVTPQGKAPTLREAFRVLRPGGSLNLVDFEDREGPPCGLHGFLAGALHSRHGSSPHDFVLELLKDTGFAQPLVVQNRSTIMGKIVFYKAIRGDQPSPTAA